MKGLHTIKLDTVKVEEKTFTYKQGDKEGQEGKLWNVSIMHNNDWYGGAVFKKSHADALQEKQGQELELFFYEEIYNDKPYAKWIFPKDRKRPMIELTQRIEALEKANEDRIEGLHNLASNLVRNDGRVPPPLPKKDTTEQSETPYQKAAEQPDIESPKGDQETMDDLPF